MPKKYILKSFAPGSTKNNKRGFSNLFNLSKIGLDWNTSLIKSSIALGVSETSENKNLAYDTGDSLFAKASDITKVNGDYVAFFDKSYPLRREYLRMFALNGEINFVLDTITDEAIVQDENNYFAYPDIDQLKAKLKASEESREVINIINESFRKVYQLYGWNESNDAWQYFKKFLIDGFLAFEIIFNFEHNSYKATDILGFKELDPVTLEPAIVKDENGYDIKVWYQFKGDPEKERIIPDSNMIYISWAKGNFPSRVSYLEGLTRSFNMLRQLENSRIIWNVQNAQKRIKMVVPIGAQNEDRARTRLRLLQAYYNEDVNIDDFSGEMTVNGQAKFSFAKTYIFPSKEGSQTEISELGVEGYDFNSIETLKYFWRRFIIETKVPANRFTLDINAPANQPENGEASITREEYAFSRFIYRLQSIFQEILLKPTWILFSIKKPSLASNNLIKSCIGIVYNDENLFTLSKERSIASEGAQTIQTLQSIQDAQQKPYFSTQFLIEKYLGLSNDDLKLNEKYKLKEAVKEVKNKVENPEQEIGGMPNAGGFDMGLGGADTGDFGQEPEAGGAPEESPEMAPEPTA